MRVVELAEIERALEAIDLVPAIEEAFVAYSAGRAVVPPVGELLFENPPGEVHIKYGYLRDGAHFVVKVASGFYGNPALGLPSGDGLMLMFEQRTGRPVATLVDRARLTDVRTAVAGAIAARALAPPDISSVGVLGAGVQAKLQVVELNKLVPCRHVVVWGRREEAVEAYRREMAELGFTVDAADEPAEVASRCRLIVTATPSKVPLLHLEDVHAGTHITAVGSDTVGKQELEASILGRADRIVADSLSQCRERGEIAHALAEGLIGEDDVVELGNVLAGGGGGRGGDEEITVADLTGLAVQDVQAAEAVWRAVHETPNGEGDTGS